MPQSKVVEDNLLAVSELLDKIYLPERELNDVLLGGWNHLVQNIFGGFVKATEEASNNPSAELSLANREMARAIEENLDVVDRILEAFNAVVLSSFGQTDGRSSVGHRGLKGRDVAFRGAKRFAKIRDVLRQARDLANSLLDSPAAGRPASRRPGPAQRASAGIALATLVRPPPTPPPVIANGPGQATARHEMAAAPDNNEEAASQYESGSHSDQESGGWSFLYM